MTNDEVIINSRIIPLLEIEGDIIQFKDYDLDIVYRRVLDPANQKTPLWSIHFKDSNQTNWFTASGFLTKQYSIARTDKILAEIQENIGGKLLDQKFVRYKTYIKSMFLMSGFDLESEPVNMADKILFEMLTDIDIDEINSRRCLSFCAINSFAGDFALTLYYGILNLYSSDKDGKTIRHNVNNIFILDEFGKRLVHNNVLDLNYLDVKNVKQKVKRTINRYKKIPIDIIFMDRIRINFSKRFIKAFCTLFDALPDEFKNLYYVTHILSHLCSLSNNIYFEIKLRNFLTSYMVSLHLSEEDL